MNRNEALLDRLADLVGYRRVGNITASTREIILAAAVLRESQPIVYERVHREFAFLPVWPIIKNEVNHPADALRVVSDLASGSIDNLPPVSYGVLQLIEVRNADDAAFMAQAAFSDSSGLSQRDALRVNLQIPAAIIDPVLHAAKVCAPYAGSEQMLDAEREIARRAMMRHGNPASLFDMRPWDEVALRALCIGEDASVTDVIAAHKLGGLDPAKIPAAVLYMTEEGLCSLPPVVADIMDDALATPSKVGDLRPREPDETPSIRSMIFTNESYARSTELESIYAKRYDVPVEIVAATKAASPGTTLREIVSALA